MQYPNTYKRFGDDDRNLFPDVFEPSLLHLSAAFRHGAPTLSDSAATTRWYAVRSMVLGHLIEAVADLPWSANLVLRGSMLLKQWFGAAAREPGDIDWVVRPYTIRIDDPISKDLFIDLQNIGKSEAFASKTGVIIDDIRVDDIWTYERVPGRRIVYFWRTADGLISFAQMDFVFGETMWKEPVPTAIDISGGKRVTVWTANREQSLAWKLMWLDNDIHPQGKDLYDAVLLAEHTLISPEFIELALSDRIKRMGGAKLPSDFPMRWHIDWENFKLEYPQVEGDAQHWKQRLTQALLQSRELF